MVALCSSTLAPSVLEPWYDRQLRVISQTIPFTRSLINVYHSYMSLNMIVSAF